MDRMFRFVIITVHNKMKIKIKQQEVNKMKKIESFAKIGVSMVFLFVVLAYSGSAAGKFNIPLNWVLGPTGTSIDNNNNGLVDASFFNDIWVNESGDTMTGTLIGLNLNMTFGNFSQQVIMLGNVGIGTISPNDALEVIGNVRVSGSINATNLNTTGQTILASSSGNVGIGNTIPNSTLDVSGNANISGIFYGGSINVTGTIEATTFIGDGTSLTGIVSSTPPWNSSGNIVYLNDSTGNVGIGTDDTPGTKLDVKGNISSSGNISIVTNNKFCMDGTPCTKYIYYNGSDIVIQG